MSYLVCLLSHPAGPWQQPSLISSILAHSAVQPFSNPPHWAWAAPRGHSLSPCSNRRINFLISLDTVSALAG